tara:strand:+ start:318 stop:770 length:453 start_codon:yes stop_codon:yes gene_type:complete
MYTVKSVKTFHGHDGYGWECNLYNGKQKIATVVEDGWGGELKFYWTKPTSVDKLELESFCKTLPKWDCIGKMIHTDKEIFVDSLVQAKLTEGDVKKLLKKICFIDGLKVLTINLKFDENYIPKIMKRHPNATILNTMPFDKAVALYKEVA